MNHRFIPRKNYRLELSAREGCADPVRLKPELNCSWGVDASLSSSSSTSTSVGPVQFGTVTVGQAGGGSAATAPNSSANQSGISWIVVSVVCFCALLGIYIWKK